MIITSIKAYKVAWASQQTKNDYEDLGEPWDKEHVKTATILVANTGSTNSAKYKVLGSIDGGKTFDLVLKAETALAKSASDIIDITTYCTDIVVQIKAASSGAQTTITAKAVGVPI